MLRFSPLPLFAVAGAVTGLLWGSAAFGSGDLSPADQVRNLAPSLEAALADCTETAAELQAHAEALALEPDDRDSTLLLHSTAERYANQTDALGRKAEKLAELTTRLAEQPDWPPRDPSLRR